ncbi:MAG TPA: hypothetical protein VFS21_29220 [Roseiflexaceae bacterium]|nr:hypothetical protein [Roseiflexaceae bacterium]
MRNRRIDLKPLLLIIGAALAGAAWAVYNRSLVSPPYDASELRPLVWVVFATPCAMFLGWLLARPAERWWALFVSGGIYFFAPFVAARYESCAVVTGFFNPVSCFVDTQQAQQLANASGHSTYFQAIVVIHLLAAAVVALHRALNRSTIPRQRLFARRGPDQEHMRQDAGAGEPG